ncbi:hypothetical protein [Mucilaginibacter dorajii]|uniref:hypothetical protein n=1 Tax=Mucilaginibacter dorajii TaxID=692994 RepID=UPI0021673417|nr:hypothetical protein [Mucilaginibacter dorajii]MCS3732207.1 hypothetical protein [Mucilaginibacter dorajii]
MTGAFLFLTAEDFVIRFPLTKPPCDAFFTRPLYEHRDSEDTLISSLFGNPDVRSLFLLN